MKILIIILFIFCLNAYSEKNEIYSQKSEPNIYRFLSEIELPDELSFCGEKYPLHIEDVRERAERELLLNLQQPGQLILYFKRAGRFFPLFERLLKEHNMPDDIKYLSVAESALYMSRSPAGAIGLWQIMPETAKSLGLIVNEFVDERRHPEKSTIAAIKYLKQGYNQYRSWLLAAAGYNMGHSGVQNNLDFQLTNDFFELFLNEETSRYLFRIAIIKEIMQNPERYGFNMKEIEIYKPFNYQLVKVTDEISDLSAWARSYGSNYKDVKLLNPWILKRNLPKPPKGMYYEIALPKK